MISVLKLLLNDLYYLKMKEIQISRDQKTLTLEDHRMIQIPPCYFAEYDYVEKVYLELSKCVILNSFDLAQLRKLTKLTIVTKSLLQIRSTVLSPLSFLADIYIDAPQLTYIPSYLFHTLYNLKKTTLLVNRVTNIGKLIFFNNNAIEQFKLTSSILKLNPITLVSLKEIRLLDIENVAKQTRELIYFDSIYLYSFQYLETLTLNRARCSNFRLFSAIKTLNLIECFVIDLSFVSNLLNLVHLNLTECHLAVSINEFYNNTQLQTLNLSFNRIGILRTNHWRPFNYLRSVNFSNCRLHEIDRFFLLACNKSIEDVNLKSNQISILPSDFLRFCYRLYSFDISYNSLQFLDENVFIDLLNLNVLNLNVNHFRCLPHTIFYHLNELKSLNLSHNYIQCIHTKWFQFNGIYKLHRLDLNSNLIRCITVNTLSMLRNLQFLNLSKNNLHTLKAHYFANLKHLTTLNLSFNCIEMLSGTVFKDLTSLDRLKLQHNNISKIATNTFKSLVMLTVLDLGYNCIESLDDNVLTMNRNLKVLFLDGNYLRSISITLLSKLDNLTDLYLCFNCFEILNCECFQNNRLLKSVYVNEDQVDMFDEHFRKVLNLSSSFQFRL